MYYDSQVNRPAKHMTLDVWDRLHLQNTELPQPQGSLHLLQVDDEANDKDILHVWGNPFFLDSHITKALLFVLSVYAAVAYICQYAIIKGVRLLLDPLPFPSILGFCCVANYVPSTVS